MKTIIAIDAKNRFGQRIEAVQREPVTITKRGRACVVAMSIGDHQPRRKRAWKNLVKTLEGTGAYATSQGMTPERLEQRLCECKMAPCESIKWHTCESTGYVIILVARYKTS